ncbi:MAG: cell division protein FtsL [Candidatus Atribacteria bacterium]|nr:cell division protein FtsL [Candidatus Atribacteria bacterium]
MKGMCGFLLAFILTMSFLYLALQAYSIEKSFIVEMEKNRMEDLQAEKEKLEVEVSFLSSFDRIKDLATSRLGMKIPDRTMYLTEAHQKVQLEEEEKKIVQRSNGRVLKR